MADAVTSKVILNSPKRHIVVLTNVSDGTGESNVVKVDKSTLTGPNGLEPSKLRVDKIEYSVFGMSVTLSFDRTSDIKIAVLQGDGCLDFTEAGGLIDSTTGDTGDILLTTTGHTSGDTYTITLHLRKKD